MSKRRANTSGASQDALTLSEERLRLTMESATDYAIITLDINGIIISWSQGAELIFGYTAAEAVGQPGHIIFTPEDIAAKAPEKEMKTAREQGRAADERWHMRKDGSRFYMSGVMRPILNPSLSGYVKVAREMTAQKEAEEALRVSEERYRIALQSADMAAWDWDIPGNAILWNEKQYTLLGLPVSTGEITPDFFLGFVHPEDRTVIAEKLDLTSKKFVDFEAEFRIVRTDGEERWMNGFGRVVETKDGLATRMVGVMFDITARVRSVLSLHEKQMKLEIAQRSGKVGIWSYDLVKNKGIATPELIELTGYPGEEDWEINDFISLVMPEDRTQLLQLIGKASEDRTGVECEFRIQREGDAMQWLLMRGSYILLHDNSPMLIGSVIDITERKAFEEQKDNFLGIASHELKTPVTSIKAYTEVLQEMFSEAGAAEQARLMGKLDVQVDRLTGLINALLDSTRVTEGQLMLRKEIFVIDDLVRETVEMMRHSAGKHALILEPGAPDFRVLGDRERLRQVFVNLVSNAIKYSPGPAKVIIRSVATETDVIISVQDFGIGINKEMQDKVFDRFFRVTDPAVATFPGLGLGLFISAEIVYQHDGKIWLESEPQKGSTFFVRIPLHAE